MAAEHPGSKLFSIHGQSFLVFFRGFIVYGSTVRARHLQPLGPGLCWSQHASLHENCRLVRWFAQGVTAVWSGLSSHCSLLPPKKTEAELNFLLLLWYSPILLSPACRHRKALAVFFIWRKGRWEDLWFFCSPSSAKTTAVLDHYSSTHRWEEFTKNSLSKEGNQQIRRMKLPDTQIQLNSPKSWDSLFGLYWPDPIWTSLFSHWSGAETEGNCFKLLFSFIFFFPLSPPPLKFHRHLNLITTSSVQCKV